MGSGLCFFFSLREVEKGKSKGLTPLVFVSASVEHHDHIATSDASFFHQTAKGYKCCPSLRSDVNSFLHSELMGGRLDLGFLDSNGAAVRLAKRSEHEAIADGARNAQAPRGRARRFPFRSVVQSLIECLDNRRAAVGLNGEHARSLVSDPAEALHLVEGFPHSDQAGAAAGGIEDDVGQAG